MTEKITVVIPVGPYPSNVEWLDECIQSVFKQSLPPDEILIIDDMAHLKDEDYPGIRIWHSPWQLGTATAFNCGVGLANNECVFMLGSDDWLYPHCLETCLKTYEATERKGSSYFYTVLEMGDVGAVDWITNAAMVTKSLWENTGGFPILGASIAPDYIFSHVVGHFPGLCDFICVASGGALYHARTHEESSTSIAMKNTARGPLLQTIIIYLRQSWEQFGIGGASRQ